jgi:hypothetical protein
VEEPAQGIVRSRSGAGRFFVVDGCLYLVHQLWWDVVVSMIPAGVEGGFLHYLLLGLSFGHEIAVDTYIATRQRFHLAPLPTE